MQKKDLLSRTKRDLLEVAARLRIRGRSRMAKAELASAIARASEPEERPLSGSGSDRPEVKPRKQARPVRETVLVRRSWREQQAAVQHAKYEAKASQPPKAVAAPPEKGELPAGYGLDRIVLLVRDPYWVHTYWEISRDTLLEARSKLKNQWSDARSIIRVYDVTDLDFDGANAHSHFDIEVTGGASNWYINTATPNRTYCVEIGLLTSSGEFLALARSNKATTPRDMPSDITDEEWMIPDWEFEKVYALSGGFSVGQGSLELRDLVEKALGAQISSGVPGSISVSSPVGRKAGARGFWFRLGTELIVYGATEPDARVTLEGRPIRLRPDGTFTVRFALPDGERVLPAVAESADGVDRITITPIVSKRTEK
jgi:hypothetical protein